MPLHLCHKLWRTGEIYLVCLRHTHDTMFHIKKQEQSKSGPACWVHLWCWNTWRHLKLPVTWILCQQDNFDKNWRSRRAFLLDSSKSGQGESYCTFSTKKMGIFKKGSCIGRILVEKWVARSGNRNARYQLLFFYLLFSFIENRFFLIYYIFIMVSPSATSPLPFPLGSIPFLSLI